MISILHILFWGAGLLMVESPHLETAARVPSPTGMTAAQALNLRGPVMAVRIETATYANGKEGKRRPSGLFTLDAQGYLTSSEVYTATKPASSAKMTCANSYDEQKRLTVQACTIAHEQDKGTMFHMTFSYDTLGRLHAQTLKATMQDADALDFALTNSFDDEGRISKQRAAIRGSGKEFGITVSYDYQPDGATATYQDHDSDQPIMQLAHNRQGRLTEWKNFASMPLLTISYQYNAQGDVSRTISSRTISGTSTREDREPTTNTTAYTYTYDAQGNWTKCVASTVTVKGGKEVLTPTEATYRMLAYSAPPK